MSDSARPNMHSSPLASHAVCKCEVKCLVVQSSVPMVEKGSEVQYSNGRAVKCSTAIVGQLSAVHQIVGQ